MNLIKLLEEEKKSKYLLEKQLNILKQLETNKINSNNQNLKTLIFSLINKEDLKSQNTKIMNEIFILEDINWVKFLGARVEALEFQNYILLSKHEKYSNLINNYIDELVEFIEVISDIKNVVNEKKVFL